MGALILILALFLFWLVWMIYGYSKRVAFLFGLITLDVILVIITEFMSVLHAISFQYFLLSWSIVCLACSVYISRKCDFPSLLKLIRADNWIKTFLANMRWQEKSLFYGIVLVVFLIGLTGVFYEPNSSDSMQYHLSRVAHWIQNQDVEYFPTTTLRELVMSPGSEFAMLHIIVLGKNDRFAFLVQWFSMVGSAIAATLIARRLGATTVMGQLLAATISVTIPVGVLEASGTMNDYFVAFWLLCFTYFSLELLFGELTLSNQVGFGSSLGLAILAKSTAYIYALPVLVLVVIIFFYHRRKGLFSVALVAGIFVFVINLGAFARNYSTFGNLLDSPAHAVKYTNQVFTPAAVVSNLVRNASLHLNSPIAALNLLVERQVKSLHSIIGIDINDPRTTYYVQDPTFQYRLSTATRQEVYAGNFVHFMLILLGATVYLVKKRLMFDTSTAVLSGYMWVGFSMFLLFCIVLKWQPFHSRQHLPFFLYFSPFISLVLFRSFKPSVQYAIAVGLIFLSLPWVLLNSTRPLIPIQSVKMMVFALQGKTSDMAASTSDPYGIFSDKDIQLFREMEPLREPLLGAMDHLVSPACRDFGLIEGVNTYHYEYPVWKLLARKFGNTFRLKHMSVANSSEVTVNNHPDFDPCILISLSSYAPERLDIDGNIYLWEFQATNSSDGSCCMVSLYMRRSR